ncbi:39S ribosomal protein S30, mitochondrial [Hemicordylus capensis]|uniref:39S ribosomal protein S30, mitochondrial n=1 Tax=Hemicordylus capensis TaxID=884348 RepID=UPI0023025828|nr:39S ribosomal protein S30, mitochondrial [Hemicordylus capensis]
MRSRRRRQPSRTATTSPGHAAAFPLPVTKMAAPRGPWLLRGARWLHTEVSAAPVAPPLPVPSSLYPPVVASRTAKSQAAKLRRRELFYQEIHDAPSVEEKLRLYGKRQRLKYVVYPQTWAINADRWYQNFTKTVFVQGLPAAAVEEGEGEHGEGASAGGLDLAELRSLVCDVLLQEHFYQRKRSAFLYRENEQGPVPFLTHLVPALTTSLAAVNPVFASSSAIDFQPEVNFYWMHGETRVPCGPRRGRIEPLRFQIDDKPLCQIRISKQLSEFVPLDYIAPGDIPVLNVLPDKLPLFKRQYDNKIFIGSKVADPCTYGHTQFHIIPDKLKRERLLKRNLHDQIEVPFRANGITSLFAWTGAQAMYQGFWSQADVSRPFVSQAVITDGRYFGFFCYQLNTLALSADADKNNPRKNICWGTESQPLYEAIEDNNVKGFNDEVLFQLVKFLLNGPKEL